MYVPAAAVVSAAVAVVTSPTAVVNVTQNRANAGILKIYMLVCLVSVI